MPPAPDLPTSPTSLLWAHQLKREHGFLLDRMQKLEAEIVRLQHPRHLHQSLAHDQTSDSVELAMPPKMVKKEMELAKSLQDQISSDSSSGRTTTDSRLLALPPELRNQIFRDVVKYDYGRIFVGPQGYDRPPLLETCKMIRADALRLFYYTNAFYGEPVDFDYSPISKFFAVPEAQNLRTLLNFSLEVIGMPNWENVVDWVKRYHFGLLVHDVPERKGQLVRMSLRELFAMARAMRGQEWEEVEARLYAARPALIALDRNWAL